MQRPLSFLKSFHSFLRAILNIDHNLRQPTFIIHDQQIFLLFPSSILHSPLQLFVFLSTTFSFVDECVWVSAGLLSGCSKWFVTRWALCPLLRVDLRTLHFADIGCPVEA